VPTGATHIGGGDLDNGLVSWAVDNLAPGGMVKVSFRVSATQTVVNETYGVAAAGGFRAQGGQTVTTIVSAGDRYVATSGVDGLNDCTVSATPCATIQQALDLVNTGEVVRVATGVYGGSLVREDDQGNEYTQVAFVNTGLTLLGLF
jgi:hypothetical protein